MAEQESQTKFEVYEMPEGRGQVIVSFSDSELSIGVMTLNPGQQLPQHARPVDEQLIQLSGQTRIDYYDGDAIAETELLEQNGTTIVLADRPHSHVNPSDAEPSMVMSRFDGDFTEVMAGIRQNRRII